MISVSSVRCYLEILDVLGTIPLVGSISAGLLRIPTGIVLLVCYAARNYFFSKGSVNADRVLEASLYQFIAFTFEVVPVIGSLFHLIIYNGTNNLLLPRFQVLSLKSKLSFQNSR